MIHNQCPVCDKVISRRSYHFHKGSTQCQVNCEINAMARLGKYPVLRRHLKMLERNKIEYTVHPGACRGEGMLWVPYVSRPVEFLCASLKNRALKWALKKYANDSRFNATYEAALEICEDGLGNKHILNFVLDRFSEENTVRVPRLDEELSTLRLSLESHIDHLYSTMDSLMKIRGAQCSTVSADERRSRLERDFERNNFLSIRHYTKQLLDREVITLTEYRLLEDSISTLQQHSKRYEYAGLIRG